MLHKFALGLVVLAVVSVSTLVRAQPLEVACDGPLQSDTMRHPQMRVVPRAWRDLAAMPASVVGWDDADWARAGAFALPTLAFMWPIHPSLDVRAYRWLKEHDRPHIKKYFPKIKTLSISSFLVGYGAVLFGTAWLTNNERLFEYASLSLETVAIVQFYHSVTKLLVGRQSPYQTKGEEPGIYGPTRLHFPGGTPSGHGMTIWALLFVLADYYQYWPLYALTFAGGIYASTSLVYRRQHYISDVIWGAGMGIYMGRWIVRHRSSRYRCKSHRELPLRQRMTIMPAYSEERRGFLVTLSIQH